MNYLRIRNSFNFHVPHVFSVCKGTRITRWLLVPVDVIRRCWYITTRVYKTKCLNVSKKFISLFSFFQITIHDWIGSLQVVAQVEQCSCKRKEENETVPQHWLKWQSSGRTQCTFGVCSYSFCATRRQAQVVKHLVLEPTCDCTSTRRKALVENGTTFVLQVVVAVLIWICVLWIVATVVATKNVTPCTQALGRIWINFVRPKSLKMKIKILFAFKRFLRVWTLP